MIQNEMKLAKTYIGRFVNKYNHESQLTFMFTVNLED
jgi:hypothetical protein